MESNSLVLSTSSCRICLQNGATYPIFDYSLSQSINMQLNKCFIEKVEDLKGYPRNICSSCKKNLEMLSEFIDKYKKTCEILKETLVKVKTEVDYSFTDDDDDDDFVWKEENSVEIKKENNIKNEIFCQTSAILKKIKPMQDLKISRIRGKKCKNEKESKRQLKWNNERWFKKKDTQYVKDKIQSRPKQKLKKVGKDISDKHRDKEKSYMKDTEENSVLCDYCGAVFKDKSKLKDHIHVTHFPNAPVTCKICSKTYLSEKRLKEHIYRFHGEMKFKCEHCSSLFASKSVLNVHIKNVHYKHLKPKKIYSCKVCDKKYKSPAAIIVHERTVHTGVLPCVCKICNKAFAHESYLRQHMRLHTGELPFLCPICHRGCTQLSNMKSHLRVHKMSELNEDIMKKINPNYLKLLKNC